MNSIELKKKLQEMASENNAYNKEVYNGIIDAIMNRYMTIVDYMEEKAIATFKGFLKKGVLVW